MSVFVSLLKKASYEEDTQGANISQSHVTDLTGTFNDEHVSLRPGVNESPAQW